jgi:hypothetical protein
MAMAMAMAMAMMTMMTMMTMMKELGCLYQILTEMVAMAFSFLLF